MWADVAARVDPLLIDAVVFLGAATVSVLLFSRLGLGAIVGYLAAGAAIGPDGLGQLGFGSFKDPDDVLHFAELGVVLLLFVIGLELRPQRLWRLKADIFGLGLAQVAIAGAVVVGAVLTLTPGASWQIAVAIGAALALSSTAFAVQIMRQRRTLSSPHGDRAFSILLFQDISIVPLLGLVIVLSPRGADGGFGLSEVLLALGALAAVVVLGRYALRPLFQAIAASRAWEIFTAAALLVVMGAATMMQAAGLSMAMGAFLAGVLLAESEFRHQLETDIEPFRGLLLGLFFIGVGMGIDWQVVADNAALVLGAALALYVFKTLIIIAIARAAGSGWRDALKIGALLGQGGEFGFVLIAEGQSGALWPGTTASLLTAVITITMLMTPLAVMAADWAVARARAEDEDDLPGMEEAEAAPVIVAGFGRFGQVVARMMRMRGHAVTLIDNSPSRIRVARTFGNKVFFGDLRRGDILRTAGVAEARAIFLCGDEPEANAAALTALRERYPNLLVAARAVDRFDHLRLEKLGADLVVRDTFESALSLAVDALREMDDEHATADFVREFRRADERLLKLQSEYGAREAYEKMREDFSLADEPGPS